MSRGMDYETKLSSRRDAGRGRGTASSVRSVNYATSPLLASKTGSTAGYSVSPR